MDNVNAAPRLLSLQLLKEITNNFDKDRIVGRGSYGKVYKGEHTNGEMIAVKVLHHIPGLDDEQFEKEYHNISSLKHKNVVRLVGYCHETQREFLPHNGRVVLTELTQRALCFEFMQNGSLASFLTDESNEHDWCTRYAIIKGICQGLKYLHEELDPPMYHLDLKPANVLLDDQMVPKIADFGLSRLFAGDGSHITTNAIGTPGYVPPEYIDSAIISIKFDIYSLGVVIIKILAGPTGYFRSAEMSAQEFIELVHAKWKNKLQKTSGYMLDQHSILVKRCTEIALSCVNANRRERPSIGLIINMLTEMETAFLDVPGMMPMPMCNELRRVQLSIKNSKSAPLSECNIKLMLELTGDYNNDRPGLDLVVVLDVSRSSMGSKKMDQLKTAMGFVVQMLSSIDRLSVVIFSEAARMICPLQQITEASRPRLEELILQELIDDIWCPGGTNIGDGLQAGLTILADRNVSVGRVAAIMLTSGDRESHYGEATRISAGNVPVYTFGFGKESDPMVLSALAANSLGGTFSHVENNTEGGALTMAFSQCLSGLLTVAVQDLELTVAADGDGSTIMAVTSGSYPQTHNSNSVTVRFGDLYSTEVRKVIVKLYLSAITSERSVQVLEVAYSYISSSGMKQKIVSPLEKVTMWCTSSVANLDLQEKPAELQMEEARLQTAKMINEARSMADGNNLLFSQLKLAEAENILAEQSNPLLRTEIQELIKLFVTPDTYDELGRLYALSSESSHGRQRFTARGRNDKIMRLFPTPHMDMYLEKAKKFLQETTLSSHIASQDTDTTQDTRITQDTADTNMANSLPGDFFVGRPANQHLPGDYFVGRPDNLQEYQYNKGPAKLPVSWPWKKCKPY